MLDKLRFIWEHFVLFFEIVCIASTDTSICRDTCLIDDRG